MSLDKIANRLVDISTVYYGNVIFRSTVRPYGGRFSKYDLMQANICHQAIFYPTTIYKTNSYYTEISRSSMARDPDFDLDKLLLGSTETAGESWRALQDAAG